MKNNVIIILIIICIFIILIGATIFSLVKFSVINPFSSCLGMLQILFTDKEYTVVQNFPHKVIFSKSSGETNPGKMLDIYMQEKGFKMVDQLGGMLIYSNGTEEQCIMFSANNYYSKWVWE